MLTACFMWTTNPRLLSSAIALVGGGCVRRQIFPQGFLKTMRLSGKTSSMRDRREERYHCSFPLHRRGAALGCAGVALTSEAPIGFLPPDPIALKVVALAPDTA